MRKLDDVEEMNYEHQVEIKEEGNLSVEQMRSQLEQAKQENVVLQKKLRNSYRRQSVDVSEINEAVDMAAQFGFLSVFFLFFSLFSFFFIFFCFFRLEKMKKERENYRLLAKKLQADANASASRAAQQQELVDRIRSLEFQLMQKAVNRLLPSLRKYCLGALTESMRIWLGRRAPART